MNLNPNPNPKSKSNLNLRVSSNLGSPEDRLDIVLKKEMGQILIRLAVLLEVNSEVTAILHVCPKDASDYFLIASNNSSANAKRKQARVRELLRKKKSLIAKWMLPNFMN